MLSLLIAVSFTQKPMTSSYMGVTCSFISLLFSFDNKAGIGFSGVLSELLVVTSNY